MLSVRDMLYKDLDRLKAGVDKDIHANNKHKKRSKWDILQNKNSFIIMHESTYQKDIPFIDVYVSNNRTSSIWSQNWEN